jgi:hypothetical protein
MILVALIPAVGMAVSGRRQPLTAPVTRHPVVQE